MLINLLIRTQIKVSKFPKIHEKRMVKFYTFEKITSLKQYAHCSKARSLEYIKCPRVYQGKIIMMRIKIYIFITGLNKQIYHIGIFRTHK